MDIDRDKLISAVYSAGMAPEYFDESLDTIDTLVFKKTAAFSGHSPVPDIDELSPKNDTNKPEIDPEILHHVQRSNEINDRLGRTEPEKSRTDLLLDTTPNPAFIFDQQENIVAMNDLAKNENANQECQKLAEYCTNTHILEKIRKFMAKATRQKLLIEPGYINAEQNENTCILVRKIDADLKVHPDKFYRQSRSLYFFTVVNLSFDPSRAELFKETYGLTGAEVAVAVHLASGMQLPEIPNTASYAHPLGISAFAP